MEAHKKTNRGSAIISYVLSGLYQLLNWLFPGVVAPIVFIGIHSVIIAFGVFMFIWVYIAIGIGFLSGKMAEKDKTGVRLALKTFPARIFLGLIYWILPLGLYIYSINGYSLLYPFVWFPLWFPLLYYVIENRIRAKEKSINSPVVAYDTN